MNQIVYCGVAGSYAEEAAMCYFGDTAQFQTAASFTDAFEMLKMEKADFAVLPIENSSTGAIAAVYDLMGRYGFFIVGEYFIKINHCLMAKSGCTMDTITQVFSHEQGLSQSASFLAKHPNWRVTPVYNTAAAAKMVSEGIDAHQAAIASKRAAEIYHLNILAEKTNFKDENQTRFIVISPKVHHGAENNKVSLAFTLPNSSGSLYRVLKIFARENLNLLKIESRPVPDKNWEYLFFLDFTAETIDARLQKILEEISQSVQTLKVLGYYKNAIEQERKNDE
ncbi:MAG: prephenate dehydratase [Oscillospiraceae bacterium]